MPKPEIVTRQGKPASVIVRRLDFAEEDALKNGVKEKSREFTEKGSELYPKA